MTFLPGRAGLSKISEQFGAMLISHLWRSFLLEVNLLNHLGEKNYYGGGTSHALEAGVCWSQV